MWDNGSDKLVQINHPNIPQMFGDRDTNGKPDGGFEKMFSFMDVIEVHPLDNIFKKPAALPNEREQGNTIFHWLQLLNLGYRMPGVVNTDAHYNFHGSGWLRNYIKSDVDDPTKAKVGELVHTCEHGNITMTNGPFLEVWAAAGSGNDKAGVGDDLAAPGGKVTAAGPRAMPELVGGESRAGVRQRPARREGELHRADAFAEVSRARRWSSTRRFRWRWSATRTWSWPASAKARSSAR